MGNVGNGILNTMSAFTFSLGVVECFFGYRMLKLTLGVTGFIVGGLMCAGLAYEMTKGHPVIALIAGLVGGIVGSLLMLGLFVFGVFILGAVLGIILWEFIGIGFIGMTHLSIVIPTAIVGGIAAVIMRKNMIIISTSFIGAYLIAFSIGRFTGMPNKVFRFHQFNELREFGSQFFVMSLIWIFAGIAGIIVQHKYTATSAEAER